MALVLFLFLALCCCCLVIPRRRPGLVVPQVIAADRSATGGQVPGHQEDGGTLGRGAAPLFFCVFHPWPGAAGYIFFLVEYQIVKNLVS